MLGKGWQAAAELAPGDYLSSHNGQWVRLDEVCTTDENVPVYNIQVADYHTYFVGSSEWGFSIWAHNRDCSAHAKILRITLKAAGHAVEKFAAHLVPTGKWLVSKVGDKVRDLQRILNEAGVGLDHAANGFFTKDARHLGTHTHKFIHYLHETISPLAGNRGAIIQKLREITELLKKGTLKF